MHIPVSPSTKPLTLDWSSSGPWESSVRTGTEHLGHHSDIWCVWLSPMGLLSLRLWVSPVFTGATFGHTWSRLTFLLQNQVKLAAFLAGGGTTCCVFTAENTYLIFLKRSEAWILLCSGLVVWPSSFWFHGVKVFTISAHVAGINWLGGPHMRPRTYFHAKFQVQD